MSKAILVIDTPNTCKECPLKDSDRGPASCVFRSWYTLSVNDTYKTNKWCPLKPLPNEISHSEIEDEYDYWEIEGYNQCLKEILGGNE